MISLGITYLPIYYIMCIELKEISAWCLASQRRNIVTIHLTLENSKGEVCDEGEAIYFTYDAAAVFLLKSQIDRMTIAMLTRLRLASIIGVLAM